MQTHKKVPLNDINKIFDFNTLNSLFNEVNKELASKSNISNDVDKTKWRPQYRITDDENIQTITFDVAGAKKSDISVVLSENSLKVTCKRVIFGKTQTVNESFVVGKNVIRDEITSSYQDGVLTIKVPLDTKATVKEKIIEVL